ncbi:hypothetical protein [Nonomuraea jiangxiensis]|uniref:4-amino-4-deoxy-L-arabinose transferase n=1 Tax=Nonomuraea jiangxiensis TaxID=633440 RepID=A0A1G8G101_9ACTN|nr:hypothetical protein [Nonomuraea jiangxiensis]SDH88048.1 hypothetical protein SAMN05421869_103497 [Nonomuraea jiangxiensis]
MTFVTRLLARPVAKGWGRSGWVPAALVFAGAVAVFLWCGVSVRDVAAFVAYVGGAVALPGTLVWRALAGGGRSPAEDVAAGLALGYAIEVLAYIPARAVGAPLLVLVPPVVVIGIFVAVPGLRRHWRGDRSGERMPGWCAWALAGVVGYLIIWSTIHLYRVPVTAAYVDMPYHLALVGEVKNHMPPTMPTVLGERLAYHWFVYADLAATSWVTGIEPVTLVYRLSTLPMTAAMVVLVAAIGRRAGGWWGAGVAAVGVAYFLFGPVLHEDVVFPTRSMFTAWASPTQTFGALLFAPVVLLLVGGRRPWAVLGVLLLALTGAKATFLPLLLAGLVVVMAVQAVRRGPWREWVGPAAMTSGCLLIAHVVVFGRGAHGTVVAPFATMRDLWGVVAGVGMPELASVSAVPLLVLTVVHLFCLACVWGGVAGLGRRVLEPPVLLLLGMGLAGIGAVVVLGHPAASQLYFLEGVRPYLSIAAVCGALAAWRPAVPGGMVALGAGGALLAWVVEVPGGPLVRVVVPYLVLGVAAAVVAWRRRHVLAVVALLAGYAVPASAWEVVGHVLPDEDRRERLIPAGARAAGRWLREHSAPGDVVATDLHCRYPQWRTCDSRHHWVSGFSERRVLVEGWAYAESTQSRTELFVTSYLGVPFADPARLAANDAVFRAPSAENVQHLAQKYGVKWLFTGLNPKLGRFAQLRFRNGTSAVYRIPER